MIILIAITAIVFVFVAPENAYPLVYLRYLFGGLLVFFLPGYSLIKLLFPSKEIDNIERTALSIGLSLALVPIIGIALNYTPWGITFIPITLSLFAVTSIFATIAIVREFQTNPTSK
ncbi:MAG: DUF1616 domain-containing protein [Clostridiales bacterium]|nr:DUF1616 domain-containing protein [Clostridiales bacterium]